MTAYDADGRDPGLAAERTDLAWNRSGLSLVACGAAILHGIGRPPLRAGNTAVGTVVLALGAGIWALGAWHVHRMRRRGAARATRMDLAPIAAGVVCVGVAAFVIALVGPS